MHCSRSSKCVKIENVSTAATSGRYFMPRRLKKFLFAGLIAFIPSQAFAQTSGSTSTSSTQSHRRATDDAGLATPTGNEVNFGVGHYNYVEPGATSISIHGPKFGGGYTGTFSLSKDQLWFA